jgi:hypothetical protein
MEDLASCEKGKIVIPLEFQKGIGSYLNVFETSRSDRRSHFNTLSSFTHQNCCVISFSRSPCLVQI